MKALKGQTNIVSCDDFTVVPHENGIGGDVFIRMELLTSLQQVLRQKTLSEQEIIKLGKDISKALILCEKKNIVHRDIKPANIMVSEFGDYELGDFGVSKIMSHTTYATVMGTPEYEAPEVIHMERYGKAADIYSLGITLYWLLNDRKMPFIDADEQLTSELKIKAMERRYRGEKLPAPKNGSDELKKIVMKACEYRSEERYVSAQELYDALNELGSGKTYTKNTVSGYQTEPSSEDGWMESGKTVGKIMDDFSSRQTGGNSWGGGGTIGRTIGKLKENTEKKKKEEKQKEVQEESKTIGVKKAYQEQKKKVEAKKVVTAESKTKKVKKTTFGYVWSFLIIGLFCFLAYEFLIKDGLVGESDYVHDLYYNGVYYNTSGILITTALFCILMLPQLGYLLFNAKKTYLSKWKKETDGVAALAMGGSLAWRFWNIIDLGNLGIAFVQEIVAFLIFCFLYMCWIVGRERINDRCYDFE